MIPGYVLFQIDRRTFALSLDDVREIVRLGGLERLPGSRPPMVGVIVLRGNPLPILDIRGSGRAKATGALDDEEHGDVLVMDFLGDPVGIAVDAVLAVVPENALPESSEAPPKSLPSYVIGIRRGADGPVMLVDLEKLLDVTAEGWTEALTGPVAGACLA